ncbi:MAG: hypothetical protein AB7G37_20760, partial [Solirubrobacteraceae bacterium]
MHDALTQLAAVFADPGASDASKVLDGVRKRWPALGADEQAALTPVAQLAADRVAAAAAQARPSLFDLVPENAGPPNQDPVREPATPAGPPDVVADEPTAPGGPPADDADYLAYLDALGHEHPDGGDPAADDDPLAGVAFVGEAGPGDDPGALDGPPPVWEEDPPAPSFSDASSFTPGPAAPAGPRPRRRPLDHVDPDALLSLLGLESFRPGQREAVQAALEGRDSLVVMPTGGGKS